MTRTEIINHYLTKCNLGSNYLEIGYYNGDNFRKIQVESKIAVDPNPLTKDKQLLKMTSDDFFDKLGSFVGFDVIFIDGLHTYQQVLKDVNNSLQCLNQNGVIILHDCAPTKLQETMVPRPTPVGRWNGDVYKTWIEICNGFIEWPMELEHRPLCYCIDTDEGLGIIDTKYVHDRFNDLNAKEVIDHQAFWSIYWNNRAEALNLVSLEHWKNGPLSK